MPLRVPDYLGESMLISAAVFVTSLLQALCRDADLPEVFYDTHLCRHSRACDSLICSQGTLPLCGCCSWQAIASPPSGLGTTYRSDYRILVRSDDQFVDRTPLVRFAIHHPRRLNSSYGERLGVI